MSDLKQRLARKARLSPMRGGGSLSVGTDGNYVAKSYITDDGMRLVNPDGPEALARIEALETQLAEAREILSFDPTGFPGMEEAAIEWAGKISGPKGGKPFHPDPIMVLEMCEDIAKRAFASSPSCPRCGHTTDNEIHTFGCGDTPDAQ